MSQDQWVVCTKGQGYRHEGDGPSGRMRHFKPNSVGIVKEVSGDHTTVWLIGNDETWNVPSKSLREVDVRKTGDQHKRKICNVCHCLLPVGQFAINQRNKDRLVRRPSCKHCRTDIDKRAPKTSQAKAKEKERPKKGTSFMCPICAKRSIAGVTAKIVADHDHHTGNIRDFICDSCNTGLGRFKNGQDCLRDALEYIREHE